MRFLINSFRDYLAERLWLRPALFGVVAVLAVVLAMAFDQMIPLSFDFRITEDTIRSLLSIMATAMLTVATFAASVMLSAYVAAISASTPRAFSIVVADSTSKQAISTFIGAFTFSVVSLIGLNVGAFQINGRIVLFFTTLWVFVWVVATLIYWIDHVARLSTVSSTIAKVSDRARDMLYRHLSYPGHGGTPVMASVAPPEDAQPVISRVTGTVQHIDVEALGACAEACDVTIRVAVRLGDLIGKGRTVAWVCGGTTDDATRQRIAEAIRIGQSRHRSEDPVLAVQTLSEIADRALSPAVNDPGTAKDILDALVQVFSDAVEISHEKGTGSQNPRVLVPMLEPDVILSAAFEQISRDGAGFVEVAEHLQLALSAIAGCMPASWMQPLKAQAARSLERAEAVIDNSHDLARIRAAARLVDS